MRDEGAPERLDGQRILADLPAELRDRLRAFTLLAEVDSTNRFLLEGDDPAGGGVAACMAEFQSAGRGRRGRAWISPVGANLYLSVLRVYSMAPESLQALSLAVGVAGARALQSLGVPAVALKWPNDIQLDGKKLGGVLLEMAGASGGSWRVVAGIGINVAMPRDAGADIEQPWTDLAAHGVPADRNRVASRVLAEVIAAGEQFANAGFADFHDEWQRLDALRDREVVLEDGAEKRYGTARGVDTSGALLLDVNGRRERIVCGDISLRAVPGD